MTSASRLGSGSALEAPSCARRPRAAEQGAGLAGVCPGVGRPQPLPFFLPPCSAVHSFYSD